MKFKLWLEEDNYRPGKALLRGPQDLPIKRINVQRIIDILSKNDIGVKKAIVKFFNECQWGDKSGAVKVTITPKINVKIQKLHHDLEGNDVWLMKRYYFIDDVNFAEKEDTVAYEILDEVKKVNKEQLENLSKKVDLKRLVECINSKINNIRSETLLPNQKIKKLSDNEYNLLCYVRGSGKTGYVGASTTDNINEVLVSISNHKNTGLIKIIITVISNVSSGSTGGGSWVLMPSDFEEVFAPSQSDDEISDFIVTALRTF